uniref:Uncharacterized protein n=1 Tax=Knipowitschia caucasica TaxID=637954 RepID=A0AAV2MAB1_KNICA
MLYILVEEEERSTQNLHLRPRVVTMGSGAWVMPGQLDIVRKRHSSHPIQMLIWQQAPVSVSAAMSRRRVTEKDGHPDAFLI